MRISRRPLLLILLLALGLRLIALSSRSLWYDEAFAVLFSEKGLTAMLYGTLTPVNGAAADVHPLLYYMTLDGWMQLFGQSLAAVRLYSVLVGVATVGLLYLLGRTLFSESTALVAALIAAVAPFHVQYSQETRMYALLGLLLIAATWCFVRGWSTDQRRYWIGFGILSGLAMYAQQLAAFYLAALGLVPLLMRRRRIGVMIGAGLALVIYLPWLVNLPSQFGKISAYWIPQPGIAQIFMTWWAFIFAELPVQSAPILVLTFVTLSILLVFLAYGAVKILRRRGSDREPLFFTLWLAIVPILFMWLVSQWRPVYLIRAMLPSALMLYLSLAWLLTRVRFPTLIRLILIVPWGATALDGLYTHYTWNTFPRPPFDAADAAIAARWQPGDRLVHANKITLLPMVYYNRALNHTYVRDMPGSGSDTLARPTQESLGLLADDCTAAAAKGSPRVWFVIFSRQIDEQQGKSPDVTWLDTHYRQVSRESFNDLLVYLYDQPDADAQKATCEPEP